MTFKNVTLSFLSICSLSVFGQQSISEDSFKQEPKLSYLDSVKLSFVNDPIASCVDSLWMNELANLDIYDDLNSDISTINLDESVDYELSTELLKARLKEMDARSPFNIEYNPGLENIIKSFLKNRKRSFERLMAVSEYYFPMFEEALAKQNVPLEIKYLAVVESALNPKAVSRMGATGLWQFMYQTGKQYNLHIDSYVDERSDPLKASAAAAQYMTNMYRIFGDWDLVLASYNSGPGNVAKAIRRSGGQQNYWNIRKHLPKETQGYLPAFLATMYIYEYHKEHGINPQRAIVKHFDTDTIMVKRHLSFKQISDLIDIPVSQLQVLNPSYKINAVPVYKDKNHYIRLPLDKIAVFTSNEDKIYAYADYEANQRERPYTSTNTAVASSDDSDGKYITSTKYHKVRRGESLGLISNKYGVSVSNLKKWNGLRGNMIAAGKNLKIVTSKRVRVKAQEEPQETAVASVSKSNSSKTETDSVKLHTVKSGDNLGEIAQKYDVSIDDIKNWNDLADNTVKINSKLIVEAPKSDDEDTDSNEDVASQPESDVASAKSSRQDAMTAAVAKKTKEHYYNVRKGDSLFSIAKKYPGVTINDIKKWNGIQSNHLKPGMKLKING